MARAKPIWDGGLLSQIKEDKMRREGKKERKIRHIWHTGMKAAGYI